ncbi:MAG: endonuclease/exonuclease/phosphatase family protein [bacterium]|nr:endonuclease/exonuclease/phosphatase family protein [bacterium]
MKLRLATFNAENLFARWKDRRADAKRFDNGRGRADAKHGNARQGHPNRKHGKKKHGEAPFRHDPARFREYDHKKRELTARAILSLNADVIGLQEIENLDTLKRFNHRMLGDEYPYQILIDGNDDRLIDVALLSRLPFDYIRTHQYLRTKDDRDWLFSRDCLEVGIRAGKKRVLPVFVNHFKSMHGGREDTMPRRAEQSRAVVRLLKERFGKDPGAYAWAVLGDLNDYMPSAGLKPLLSQPWIVNVVDRIKDPRDRWTHFYPGNGEYNQLDYILLSRSLAAGNPKAVPYIERRGMPRRAERAGEWWSEVDDRKRIKASDHCPVVIQLKV